MSRKFSLGIYSLIIFSIIEKIQTEKEQEHPRDEIDTGKWELEFEKDKFDGEGNPPEVRVKSYDPNISQSLSVGESHSRRRKCKKVCGCK